MRGEMQYLLISTDTREYIKTLRCHRQRVGKTSEDQPGFPASVAKVAAQNAAPSRAYFRPDLAL